MPPRARVCYICGRQYMLHSFDIHVVQCRDLFEKREMQKPVKERRSCPQDPFASLTSKGGATAEFISLSKSGTISSRELDLLNSAAQQVWNTESLVACSFCNRRFLPEKLKIHNKSCTASNPARRVDEPVKRGNNVDYDALVSKAMESGMRNDFESGNLVHCNDCGRNFNAVSFPKHAKVCKKVFVSKRKPFDSAKQRMKGTELEQYCKQRKKGGKPSYSSQPTSSLSSGGKYPGAGNFSSTRDMETRGIASKAQAGSLPKWKADSLSFRQAMRMAKAVSMAEKQSKATGVPLHMLLPAANRSMASRKQGNSSKSYSSGRSNAGSGSSSIGYDDFNDGFGAVDPSFIQCPHCGRNYNQKAGERHIPQCQSIINKPSRLSRGSGLPSYSTLSSEKSPPLNVRPSSSSRVRQNSDYSHTSSNDISYALRGQQQPIAKLSPRTSSHRQQQPNQQIAQISAPSSQTFTRTAPSAQSYAPSQYGRQPHSQYQQQQYQQAPARYASDSPRVSGQQQSRQTQFQSQAQPLPQQSQSGRRLSGGQATDSERMRSLLGSQANAPSTSGVATSGFSFYPSQQPQPQATSVVRFSSAPRGGYR